jgi:DNA repair protein RadA/Sms
VLHFEGERATRLRMVRALKNRFGPVDEVGCFDLSGDGINAVLDPSGLFVSRHHQPVPGTCVSVTLEGRRPLLAEIQALVAPSALERPRRTSTGVDSSRFAMVMAVLEARLGVPLGKADVFTSTVGGARVTEPAGDLAIAAAIASAAQSFHLPADMIAIGEIGLAGELRRVPELDRRLAEAARIGFRLAVVAAGPGTEGLRHHGDLEVLAVPDLASAMQVVHLSRPMGR